MTEKEMMLAGEHYRAFDKELSAERLACRTALRRFNDSLPEAFGSVVTKDVPACAIVAGNPARFIREV